MNIISSSIGKKFLMAVTGLSLCGFLTIHLIGNLTAYAGKSIFNSYVEHLHSLGIIINIAELGLLILAVVHIFTGLLLFFQNIKARPVRYKMNKKAGGSTLSSSTMPYSGVLILSFVIIHLIGFFVLNRYNNDVFEILTITFLNPLFALIYVVAVVIAAIHIKHGFWSAFQTLGINHPKYTPVIEKFSFAFSSLVGIGLGFLPIYLMITT
jgi:succinate dehydrogenase / fumarate reductase, cytochrome b subunit